MADLSVEIAGLSFKNSVWLSAADTTINFDKMKLGIDAGAGAVISKSYSGSYHSGHEQKKPRIFAKTCFLDSSWRPVYGRNITKFYTNYGRQGSIQCYPLSEDEWVDEMAKAQKYASKFGAYAIASLFGTADVSDMVRPAKKLEQAGIPMIELDLACPNVEELKEKGGLIKVVQGYADVTKQIADSVSIPVFAKISPQQADVAITAKAVKEAGAAGATLINQFLGFSIDIENAKPYIWGYAGMSGPWALPNALRWVSKVYSDDPSFPILGTSGVYDAEDVVRFHMAGTSAVEFCSTIMAKGYCMVTEIIEGLNSFLDRKGYKSVRDIIGIATKASYTYDEMYSLPEYYSEKSSIDQDLCIHCGKCYEMCFYEGMERTGEKAVAPCKEACPAGIDVPRYVRLVGEGKFDEAMAVVREKIPFPFICGVACFHPCEAVCARGRLDDPIAIMALKRFIAGRDTGAWKAKVKKAQPTGKRVAVVGSGPAGLTAGYYLARLGHSVTVLEASPVAGGMMRLAIPEYRLPMEVLDREIEGIKDAGVEIKTGTKVNSLDELLSKGYDAVFVATGANSDLRMGIDGEDSPGVMQCLPFLNDVKMGKKVRLGERVAVIGGGNAAVDAARTASRLGARDVTLIYRRSRAEMPATDEEVEEALLEGVCIEFLAAPIRIAKNGNLKMQCIRMKLGKPDASGRAQPEPIPGSEFNVDADTVIVAVGETSDLPSKFGLKQANGNLIWADPETLATDKAGVFAGGDVVNGPASIIESIAAGRKAAMSIDKHLGGKGEIDEVLTLPAGEVAPLNAEALPEERRVPQAQAMPLAKRLFSFDKPECGYTEEEAVKEAKRCLQCNANWAYTINEDKCVGCYNCRIICPIEGCITMKQLAK